MTTANASHIAVDDLYGSVVAEFSGQGVWRFNQNTSLALGWKQLTSADASSVSINNHSGVAAVFSSGVYRYSDYPGDSLSGWTNLTSAVANQVVSYDLSGDVAANFGNSVWIYRTTVGWANLSNSVVTGFTVTSIDAAYGEVVAEFQGHGVWRYNVSNSGFALGWHQLTSANASSLGIDFYGDVVAEFSGQGVWVYNQNTSTGSVGWSHITTADSAQVDMGGFGTVVARYPGSGLWVWTASKGWSNIPTNVQATMIDSGD